MSAGMWSFGVLLFWIIIFPLYLFKRSSLLEAAKENPQTVSMRGAKLAFLSLICVVSILSPAYNDYLQHANGLVASSHAAIKAPEPTSQSYKQEDALTQFNLAKAYLSGEGVERNLEKGNDFLKKSAEQGNADAQLMLGFFYANGLNGFVHDEKEAIKWISKSAYGGNEKAIAAIAEFDKSIVAQSLSYAERYANEIKSQMMSGGACDALKQNIDMLATSSYPDNIKVSQIDKVVDAADRAGCMMY